ncbi:MAG: Asp23/Gls24 family envelope stress response protein [Solirubrobacteraceae bacterium]|nr:Asp23/Gls24 family envelope stress response protein [Solirubrobacteraceae bacterium]
MALDSGTAGDKLTLTVHLTAALGPALPALAEQVRVAVGADLAALTGLQVDQVQVFVDDIDVDG